MFWKRKKRLPGKRKPPVFWVTFGLVVALIMTPLTAVAAPSWIRDGEASIYGGDEDARVQSGAEDVATKEEEPDSLIKHIQKSFSFFTDANGKIFNDDNEQNLPYSISLEGLILGRLGGYRVSIGKFELYEGNPYGVIAAYGFRVLRNVVYSVLFLYFLIKLIGQLFNNGARGRAEIKEIIYTSIFIMGVLYFLPVFVNWFTVARDGVIGNLSRELSGGRFPSFSTAFELVTEEKTTNGFALVVLRLAYFFAGWFYLGSYIGIALQEMGLFVLSPMALILSFRDKKIFERWCSTFFTNLIIPLLDYLFLLFPLLIKTILERFSIAHSNGLANAAVTVVAIWGVIPARNMVISLFGSSVGGAKGGVGLAAMGMMALRTMNMGRGGSAGIGGEASGGFINDLTNAERHQSNADIFEHSLLARGRELQELDSMMEMNNKTMGIPDLAESVGFGDSAVDEIASALPVEAEVSRAEENMEASAESLAASQIGQATTNADLAEEMGYVDQPSVYEPLGQIPMDNISPSFHEEGMDYMNQPSVYEPLGQMPMDNVPSPSHEEGMDYMDKTPVYDPFGQRAMADMSASSGDEGMDYMDKPPAAAPLGQEAIGDMPLGNTMEEPPYVDGEVKPFKTQSQRFEEMRYQNLQRLDEAREALRTDTGLSAHHEHAASAISASVQSQKDRIAEIDRIIGKEGRSSGNTLKAETHTAAGGVHSTLMQERAILQKEVDTAFGSTKEVDRVRAQGSYRGTAKTDYEYHQEQAKAAQNRMAVNQNVIERRMEMEQKMGNMSALSGASGKIYDNADQYKDVMNQNELIRKQASYRNFNSKAVSEVLSAEEKADFSRQRAMATGVKNVAKTAAGAVGAVTMLAGGTSAMGAGAMLGSAMASAAINRAEANVEYGKQKGVRKTGPRFTDTDEEPEKRKDLLDVPLPNGTVPPADTKPIDALAERARRGNQTVERHFSDTD